MKPLFSTKQSLLLSLGLLAAGRTDLVSRSDKAPTPEEQPPTRLTPTWPLTRPEARRKAQFERLANKYDIEVANAMLSGTWPGGKPKYEVFAVTSTVKQGGRIYGVWRWLSDSHAVRVKDENCVNLQPSEYIHTFVSQKG
jgi:hypothetical protein